MYKYVYIHIQCTKGYFSFSFFYSFLFFFLETWYGTSRARVEKFYIHEWSVVIFSSTCIYIFYKRHIETRKIWDKDSQTLVCSYNFYIAKLSDYIRQISRYYYFVINLFRRLIFQFFFVLRFLQDKKHAEIIMQDTPSASSYRPYEIGNKLIEKYELATEHCQVWSKIKLQTLALTYRLQLQQRYMTHDLIPIFWQL